MDNSAQQPESIPKAPTPTSSSIYPVPPQLSASKRKLFRYLGVIFLLMLVGGGAYYLGIQKSSSMHQNQTTQATEIPSVTPSKSPATPTANPDWATYTNPTVPVTFKYPSTVVVEYIQQKGGDDYIKISPKGNTEKKLSLSEMYIWIKDNTKELSASQWIKEWYKENYSSQDMSPSAFKGVKLNNYDAVIDPVQRAADHYVISNYILTYQKKAYRIDLNDYSYFPIDATYHRSIDENTFNEIMKTFALR